MKLDDLRVFFICKKNLQTTSMCDLHSEFWKGEKIMKMQKCSLLTLIGILMILVLLVGGCAKSVSDDAAKAPQENGVQPAEVIELRYSGLYSPPTPYATAAQTWIEWIHEKTGGRVKITPFWGGTLVGGTEAKAELVSGAVDIAHCTMYTELNYEITSSLSLFLSYASPDAETSARVSKAILEKFPEYQQEYSDVVVLGFTSGQDYCLLSTKPVRKLDDLKGMIISAGTEGERIFTELGASVIKIPPGDQYIALEKGTIDATFLPVEVLDAFKFAEVVKYVCLDIRTASAAKPAQLMNLDTYNSLPEDIKEIFMESKDVWMEAVLRDVV